MAYTTMSHAESDNKESFGTMANFGLILTLHFPHTPLFEDEVGKHNQKLKFINRQFSNSPCCVDRSVPLGPRLWILG